jgi:proline iminopeptidase
MRYSRLMEDPDPGVRARAASAWVTWEDAVISMEVNGAPGAYGARPYDAKLAFARICSHYFAHLGFLADGVLIREAGKLGPIPGVLIHGRNDIGGPAVTAWELARAWPGAELVIIDDSGHTGSAAMQDALDAAGDRMYAAVTSPRRAAS